MITFPYLQKGKGKWAKMFPSNNVNTEKGFVIREVKENERKILNLMA
jgi:hypothetical protein